MHQKPNSDRTIAMESVKYEKLLLSLPQLEPSEAMPLHILARIEAAKRKSARIHFIGFALLTTGSLISLVPITSFTIHEIGNSNFYQYLSLAFSDSDVLSVAGKDVFITLAESIPLSGITVALIATLTFLVSARLAARYTRGAFLITPLAH